jgi:hypothetical protein
MKRIYQAPELKITEMQMQLPLMLSTNPNTVDDAGWVKEDRADRGSRSDRSDYNVWKDDWSK